MNEETVFHLALEKPPGDRPALLDQVCKADAELRSRVERLLAEHEGGESFILDTPPANLGATIDSPITEQPGTVIGPYKLLQHIGEGGMGVVFMAEQTDPLQRTVALKIIKPGMDTRQVIARFEAERQAVAMMDHPNIAKVLDAGATDSGRPYFVMELVKGLPITRYCDEKHLPLCGRLESFIQVCQAVQYAHQKGIIHRDIKPNNVLVAEYDNRAVPKVIDFGMAKATAQKLTERTMFTEFGQVFGTMEYMSPEQSKFNQLDIDTRSDIYSLGVLLYELLAGSTPFEGKRLHEAAFDEMLRIIREEEPQKPSTRLSSLSLRERAGVRESAASIAANRHTEPARLSKDVQGELDWIVMKALEKDRNRRYETASGLAADVERHLHDKPVEAGSPSAIYRFRKFAGRNKAALITATVVAASLVAGTAVSTWQAVRATQAPRTVEAGLARETTLRRAAEAREKVAQAKILYENKQFDEVEKLLNSIPADLLSPDSTHARMRRLLGTLDCLHERWEEACANFTVLLQVNGLDTRLVNTMDYLRYGPVLLMLGDTTRYKQFQEQITARDLNTIDSTIAERVCKISLLLPANESVNGRLDKLYEVAVRGQSDPSKTGDEKVWTSLSLAMVDYRRGNFLKAIERCQPCMNAEKTGRTAAARAIVAMAYQQLHQDAEARTALALAHQAHEQITSGLTPRSAIYYPDVAVVFDGLYAHLVLQEADALINGRTLRAYKGYAAAEKAIGDMYSRGFYASQSDVEAAKWYRKAAEQRLAEAEVALAHMYVTGRGVATDPAEADKWLLKVTQREDALSLNNLAWKLVAGRDSELWDSRSAIVLAKHAIEKSPGAGTYWNTLGIAQYRAGDGKAAVETLEKSMELRDGGDSFDWFFLAMAHWQLGDKDEARNWYDQAVEWMEKNQPNNVELGRFRAEAAELLDTAESPSPTRPQHVENEVRNTDNPIPISPTTTDN
jgi:serine/threonine protein kinase/TPR repeat protein